MDGGGTGGTAAALGHAGVGVADTNTLAGAVRAHVAAREVGIRLVVGARLVLVDDGTAYLPGPRAGRAMAG